MEVQNSRERDGPSRSGVMGRLWWGVLQPAQPAGSTRAGAVPLRLRGCRVQRKPHSSNKCALSVGPMWRSFWKGLSATTQGAVPSTTRPASTSPGPPRQDPGAQQHPQPSMGSANRDSCSLPPHRVRRNGKRLPQSDPGATEQFLQLRGGRVCPEHSSCCSVQRAD